MPSRRLTLAAALLALSVLPATAFRAGDPPPVKVERQPLQEQVKRVLDALELLGAPLPAADRDAVRAALKEPDDARAVAALQAALDKSCVARVRIAGPNKVETRAGPARPALAEQGWRVFLVRVENPTGVTNLTRAPARPNPLQTLHCS